MLDIYTFTVIMFFLVLAGVIYFNRKNIEIKYYLFYMWRTKRFLKILDDIASLSPKIWKWIYNIGIVVCVAAMIFGLYMLFDANMKIISGEITEPASKLVLPSFSSTGEVGGNYILIPFWYWIIIIFFIMVPHELSHGIASLAEKIKVKSVGLLLLAIFPGAFVEPDEKKLEKAKLWSQLRIYAAGSYANFVTSLTIFLLLYLIIWPAFMNQPLQLMLLDVNQTSPAEIAGLKTGMNITRINGNEIKMNYLEYVSGRYLNDETGTAKPGDIINVTTDDGKDYSIELGEKDNKTYMGIIFTIPNVFEKDSKEEIMLSYIEPLLRMIFSLSLAVGIVNILPIGPLDGGLMMKATVAKYFKKHKKKITNIITLASVALLLFTMFGPYLIRFLSPLN